MTEAPHHRPVPDNHLAQLHAAGLLGIPSPLHLLVTPFGRKQTKRKEKKKKRRKTKKAVPLRRRSGGKQCRLLFLSHLVGSHGCQSKVQNQNPDRYRQHVRPAKVFHVSVPLLPLALIGNSVDNRVAGPHSYVGR
ncbi:hypothetical protein LY78DRAFT_220108 [Colletotrichum sublineola]|nr:hypothetical protein LY78DRAFT_220108 [Colletotrichum sublineola]